MCPRHVLLYTIAINIELKLVAALLLNCQNSWHPPTTEDKCCFCATVTFDACWTKAKMARVGLITTWVSQRCHGYELALYINLCGMCSDPRHSAAVFVLASYDKDRIM